MTGNQVEGWLKEIRAVAQGDVTFSNPERNVSGSAERATYTQTPNQNDGVVLLSDLLMLFKMVMYSMHQSLKFV